MAPISNEHLLDQSLLLTELTRVLAGIAQACEESNIMHTQVVDRVRLSPAAWQYAKTMCGVVNASPVVEYCNFDGFRIDRDDALPRLTFVIDYLKTP